MGLFDVFRHKEPEADPLTGGADGFFDVLDGDGRLVRYTPDADAARRIGVHPEIERLFGEKTDGDWRELTPPEAEALLASLGPAADPVSPERAPRLPLRPRSIS
jgi:hypothetical protein